MLAAIIGLPIMLLAVILQSSLISNIPLLSGTADLLLVILIAWTINEPVKYGWVWAIIGAGLATLFSGLPFPVFFLSYGIAYLLAILFHKRIWQAPILILLSVTLVSTLLEHIISMFALQVTGSTIPFLTGFTQITLPSVLLNLLLALPTYALLHYLARVIYHKDQEL
jgi:cell shape-determining protein MreD